MQHADPRFGDRSRGSIAPVRREECIERVLVQDIDIHSLVRSDPNADELRRWQWILRVERFPGLDDAHVCSSFFFFFSLRARRMAKSPKGVLRLLNFSLSSPSRR